MADVELPIAEHVIVPQAIQGPFGVVASPFQFLVTGEDHLQVDSFCSLSGVTVAIQLRFLEADSQKVVATQAAHTPNSDRTRATTVIGLAAGAVLNVRVVATGGAPRVGQLFVILRVVRGIASSRIALGTLLQGYVTAEQDLAWPGSPIVTSVEGPGALRVITGSNPNAGVAISETVPAGARWELISFRATLVADATAGTRQPRLTIDDGTNVFATLPSSFNQSAGQTITITWSQGMVFIDSTASVRASGPVPAGLQLPAGYRIRTDTTGIAAGDDWSAPTYAVREWLEAA